MNYIKINFGGEIKRGEYWARIVILAMMWIGIVYLFTHGAELDNKASDWGQGGNPGLAYMLAAGALLLYAIPYSWNAFLGRLRDAGRSPGWWVAGAILGNRAGLGLILMIIAGCLKSGQEDVWAGAEIPEFTT